MVLFFTTTLVLSILGIIGVLGIKRLEDARGQVVFSGARSFLGEVLGQALHVMERTVPSAWQRGSKAVYIAVRTSAKRLLALLVLRIEEWLEKGLAFIRHNTAPHGTTTASPFLREVAEHKRKLQETSKENAIYEE